MQTNLAQSAGVWDSASGAFISADHQRLAEVLNDYNRHFSLAWIPPKDRDATDTRPFAIIDSSPGRPPYAMRHLSEDEMKRPNEILAWIFEGDLSKHRPVDVFEKMELRNKAAELLALSSQSDLLAEEEDKWEFIARTPLNKFKIGTTQYSDYG